MAKVSASGVIAILFAASLRLGPSIAQAQDNCTPIHFARGASSLVIQGQAPANGVNCYTFKAGEGQTARLQVTGRNTIISVIGIGDARQAWTFRTKAQTYQFVVGQLMRAVQPEPYTLTLSISDDARCGLRRLDLCRNTNQLVWDVGFQRAIKQFVGARRGAYLYESPVSDQVLEVLGGPPDDVQRIGGLYQFTACRAHSCEEKGAAVLQANGRVVALGVLHTACGLPHHANDCFAHFTLTLFVRTGQEHGAVVDSLTDWAKEMIGESDQPAGMPHDKLDSVEIVSIAS
jgi:hypothetical protein